MMKALRRARLEADGGGLENRYGATHRGFESHALRFRVDLCCGVRSIGRVSLPLDAAASVLVRPWRHDRVLACTHRLSLARASRLCAANLGDRRRTSKQRPCRKLFGGRLHAAATDSDRHDVVNTARPRPAQVRTAGVASPDTGPNG